MTRHLEAGEIHAWLDGELDTTLGEDAGGARRHVELCPVCRARIEEERALRNRAGAVLDEAAPAVGPLPSLEALRERARAAPAGGSTPPTRLERYRRWAWAASVVMALGVGWAVRDQVPMGDAGLGTTSGAVSGDGEAERPSAPAADEEGEGETGTSAPGPSAEDAVGTSPAGPPVGRERLAGVPPGGDADADGLADADRLADAAPPPVREPSAPTGEGSDTAGPAEADEVVSEEARRREVDSAESVSGRALTLDAVVPAGAAEPESAAAGVRSAAGQGAAGQDAADQGAADHAGAVDRTEAAVVAEVVLTVPGLDVLSVVWDEVAPDVQGVRVLQRLEPSDTLELVIIPGSPAGEKPESALAAVLSEPLPQGWSRIVRVRDGVRIVARAPLPAEALSRLLEDVGRR